MSFGFLPARRGGQHFELVKFAVSKLKSVNLLLKGKVEREYEQAVVSYLQSSNKLRKNIITQVCEDEVEKITQASLFGFKHRPDVTIGRDGTAIEIKVITNGVAARDLLGQGLAYRTNYRFVILVLVDNTPERQIVELCSKRNSKECALFMELAENHNIFTVVGPKKQSQNIVFFPQQAASNGEVLGVPEIKITDMVPSASGQGGQGDVV